MAHQLELVEQRAPLIRLFVSNGSERSDYLPQQRVMELLPRPHAGQNLMACYYPKQSFWPDRRLFGPDVPHYRHSLNDSTATTKMAGDNEWTDGYYSLDLRNPCNDVVRQMADVRRYGQDVRLTLTAEADTTDEDLESIAQALAPFGPVELRLNHEANGCSWFRFSQGVGRLSGEAAARIYYQIAQFFLRANRIIRAANPQVKLIACYNGPGTPGALAAAVADGGLPQMGADELGAMYLPPEVLISLDQYGSLHYGWPGHRIADAPVIGPVTHTDHGSFALTSNQLCEASIRPFQQAISRHRGIATRIDLGELDFDEDIHGPEIRAQLLYESYDWIRQNPDVVGSVTFYELLDMGGLGLLQQKAYGNTTDLTASCVLKLYRDIMSWPVFCPSCQVTPLPPGRSTQLRWTSSSDSVGLRINLLAKAHTLNLGESYWHRLIFTDSAGKEHFVHGDCAELLIPPGTTAITIFALPPDGKNNSPTGFVRQMPIPVVR